MKPTDSVDDFTLEVVSGLETEGQLGEVLECRQVAEFVPFDSSATTFLPSPSPLPISHLSLHESVSDAGVDRCTGFSQVYFSYDEALLSERLQYCDVLTATTTGRYIRRGLTLY